MGCVFWFDGHSFVVSLSIVGISNIKYIVNAFTEVFGIGFVGFMG